MRRTALPRLLLVAALSTLVALAGLRIAESRGAVLMPVPWLAVLVILLLAAVVVSFGWAVRQYARGKRPGLDPLLAARIVVLATASAYTGALLLGWYGAQALAVLGDLAIESRRDVAVSGLVAAGASLVLAAAGLVVERWCEVKPPDDEPGVGSGASAGTPA